MFTANTAVQNAFLFQGFATHGQHFVDTGMGQIEAAHYLSNWASAIEQALDYITEDNADFPGVFEYEVTESFGTFLRDNLEKSRAYLVTALCSDIREFFAQGSEPLNCCQLMHIESVIGDAMVGHHA